MEYLGTPRPDVPMAEMTEISGGQAGPKSGANLEPPAAAQPRRSVTGYDASMEGKKKIQFPFLFFLSCITPKNRSIQKTYA